MKEFELYKKYSGQEFMSKIMGPNPILLAEDLLQNCEIKSGDTVCDLGSGMGLTSVFLAREFGAKVYAADLWSEPSENQAFFDSLGLGEQIKAVKADATDLPFEPEFFDSVVSVDSYNYFGRDEFYLDKKLLPYVKSGGYIYIAVSGMVADLHNNLPSELMLSWTPEQMEYMQDEGYWRAILGKSEGAEIVSIRTMKSNDDAWADWLKQENEYAINDRKSMEAGAGKYLNTLAITLRKM